SDVVQLVDADGRIEWVSPAVTRVLGYRPEEMIGRPSEPFLHPEELDHLYAELARMLADPTYTAVAEHRVLRKDGSYVWVESVGHNMTGDPSVGAMVVTYRDITERKKSQDRIRDAEERYRSLFENVPVGLFRTTPDGTHIET